MTTDVIGSITDRPPALPLKIPDWVPAAVTDLAQGLAKNFLTDPDCRPILVRLTVDPRMRPVWSQLMRRRRHDGQFLRPARLPIPDLRAVAAEPQDFAMKALFSTIPDLRAEAAELQDFAMKVLFSTIYCALVDQWPPVSLRRDVDRIRVERQKLARKLREEAEHQDTIIEQYEKDQPTRAKKLEDAATVLDELAAEGGTMCAAVVERARGNLEAHGLALLIANTCRWLFGSPLYGVTARMTSVGLDCQVSAQQVRDWWRVAASRERG